MDKLRHIDDLLRTSLGTGNYAADISSDDWLAIAKKLKQRKDRIYAMWFSLALIAVLSVGVLWAPLSNEVPAVADDAEKIEISEPNQEYIDNKELESDLAEPSSPAVLAIEDEHAKDIADPVRGALHTANEDLPMDKTIEDPMDSQEDKSVDESLAEPSFAELLAIAEMPMEQPKVQAPEWSELNAVSTTKNPFSSLRSTAWWELGVSFTPSLNNKLLKADQDLGGLIHRNFFNIIENGESAGFSTDQHIHLDRHFAGGLYVGIGLGWSTQSERIDYSYTITDAPQLNASKTAIDTYFALNPLAYVDVNHQGSNVYHFLDIPLKVGYRQQLSTRWQLRYEVRASYMLLTNTLGKKADYTYLELRDLNELNFFKKSNFAASARTGLYYNIKNFVIGAEPVFGMNLGSITNQSSAVDIRPYSYGFNLSTKLILGKN